MSTQLADKVPRSLALSPAESFHVESPAGAGKTSLLTARFIRLLAVVDHPHEILALTFTNKAAHEMRERVGSVLRQAEKGTPAKDPWVNSLLPHAGQALKKHARHGHLLNSPDGLRITTFHSFCLLLVRQCPWEAQVPLEAAVASDEDQSDLLIEAVRNTQQEIFARPRQDLVRQALQHRLLHMNNNWPALEAELVQLLARRDLLADLIHEVQAAPDMNYLNQVLHKRLARLVSSRLGDLGKSFAATELGPNWPYLRAYLYEKRKGNSGDIPATLPGSSWDDLPAWQAIAELCLTKTGTIRKQFAVTNGFCQGFAATQWAEYIKGLPEKVVLHLQALRQLPWSDAPLTDIEALFDLILLISKAMQVYGALCHRRGVMDYVELEWAALRALGEEDSPTDLQLLLDRRLRHILIDEFQDTSRNQWRLLQHLCAGWARGDGRTIFMVGDPKQSIYGFRKAEVSIFTEAKEGLPIPGQGYLKLSPLNLTTNFRSCAGLINFTNEIFGQTVMANPDTPLDEVPYQAFLPAPGQEAEGRIALAIFTKNNDKMPEEARIREAVWVAQEAKRLSRQCNAQKIGILLPARTHLAAYLKALAGEGLQVQVQEGILLQDRPEVMDIFSLARALVRPHDDLSWASLLRSAWCWVGVDVLYDLSREKGITWAEKIAAFSQDMAAPEVLKTLWGSMSRQGPEIGRRPLADLVNTIWEELAGPAAVCARFGPAGVENCRRFLHILTAAETGIPEETLIRLELLLQTAYAPPDPLAVRSPVQVMTVHRAKGLEFDFVFLPYLDWNPLGGSSKESPPYLLERLPGLAGEYLIALRPDRRQKEGNKLYGLLKGIWEKRQLGESKRLFYVAVTRAKKELYLSGLATEADGQYRARRYSFLSYLLAHNRPKSKVDFLIDPAPAKRAAPEISSQAELPAPIPFAAEKLPYRTISPSGLKGEAPRARESWPMSAQGPEGDYALARGTVIHRLLEHLAQGKGFPGENALVAAIRAEGIDEQTSLESAKAIRAEVEACLKEKFCAHILRPGHPFAASEWIIEDQAGPGTIRSGIIDRVVFDGRYWWLVDYKTTPLPPDTAIAEFLRKQESYYREQLLAYREMLVRSQQVDPSKVRLMLYFTAIPRPHEIKG